VTANLSEHFTYAEGVFSESATRHGLPNIPPAIILGNMREAAKHLEGVRSLLGTSINVSSWFRSDAVNKLVGGAPTSGHRLGYCIDFRASGLTVPATFQLIKKSSIRYDQLINEFGRWVHISFDPRFRMMAFKIGG